jgi:hypothetical protein
MKWARFGFLTAVGAALAAACGAFGGNDSSTDVTPMDAGNDARANSADGGTPVTGTDAGSGGNVDAASCVVTKESFQTEADALLASSDIEFGGQPLCNVHIGECIARFTLSPGAAAALKAGTASSVTLTLTRAISDMGDCGGGDGGCLTGAFVTKSGGLVASPLASDWNEPTVTWFYKDKPTIGWRDAGASRVGVDRGGVAGLAGVDNVMTSVTIALDPTKIDPQWVTSARKLSVTVEAVDAGNFVFITKEAASAPGLVPTAPPATLVVTYSVCGDAG